MQGLQRQRAATGRNLHHFLGLLKRLMQSCGRLQGHLDSATAHICTVQKPKPPRTTTPNIHNICTPVVHSPMCEVCTVLRLVSCCCMRVLPLIAPNFDESCCQTQGKQEHLTNFNASLSTLGLPGDGVGKRRPKLGRLRANVLVLRIGFLRPPQAKSRVKAVKWDLKFMGPWALAVTIT